MKMENLGKCYQLGYQYQQKHPEWILVHGYITNFQYPYQTIDHCWLIKDNIVYDPVIEEEYPEYVYNTLFKAKAIKKYNCREAIEKALETGHYGCWHETDDSDIKKYYDDNGNLKKEFKNK